MDQELFTTFVGPVVFAMLAGGWAFRNRPKQRPQLMLIMVLMYLTAAVSQYLHPSQELFYLLLVYLVYLVALMVWPSRQATLEHAEG